VLQPVLDRRLENICFTEAVRSLLSSSAVSRLAGFAECLMSDDTLGFVEDFTMSLFDVAVTPSTGPTGCSAVAGPRLPSENSPPSNSWELPTHQVQHFIN